MQLHHDMHHQTYVNNLNTAVGKYSELETKSPEELIKSLDSLPSDILSAVRNNGGGHVNHTMFWQIMAPNAGGDNYLIADAIGKTLATLKVSSSGSMMLVPNN